MQQGPNLWKWGFLSLVGVVGFLVLGVIVLAMIGAQASGPPAPETARDHSRPDHSGPHKATEGKPQPSQSKSEFKAEPKIVPKENIVKRDVNAYYDAAAAGDYETTYSLLTQSDRDYYTRDAWIEANQVGGSDQATYELTDVRQVSGNTYDVDILVSGTQRTTQFVYEDGRWVHDLTAEEVAMFDNNLASSSASASASASTSAAPSEVASSGEVEVRVEVSASKPVDVGIISAEDMDVPLINEQVEDKTYTFTKKEGADLSVDASEPQMDFSGDSDIHIEVYENGELAAEDSDPMMALVQY